MIQKNHPGRMITAEESVAISHRAATVDSCFIAREISHEYMMQNPPREGEYTLWLYCMYGAIYDAGRIQGIREERARRRAKA